MHLMPAGAGEFYGAAVRDGKRLPAAVDVGLRWPRLRGQWGQTASMGAHAPLGGLAQVVPDTPFIGDLGCARRTGAGCVAVGTGPVLRYFSVYGEPQVIRRKPSLDFGTQQGPDLRKTKDCDWNGRPPAPTGSG
ncbi:hypothetical protein GCM10010277_83490 [Streptomyces longisporoflavus]|nr:hypothetical protein GCM10010277_83490 [Streptomyces longisporoflavus]